MMVVPSSPMIQLPVPGKIDLSTLVGTGLTMIAITPRAVFLSHMPYHPAALRGNWGALAMNQGSADTYMGLSRILRDSAHSDKTAKQQEPQLPENLCPLCQSLLGQVIPTSEPPPGMQNRKTEFSAKEEFPPDRRTEPRHTPLLSPLPVEL
ncbi:hypothetical protein HOY80DRAFT_1000322 [Tuber brumale]|nr:hypothetical protein HOY80DRAFT_1000322 [Tuber brumale]